MQITLESTEDRTDSVDMTLRIKPGVVCPLCSNREADWFVDEANPAATNPSASPLGAGEVCSPCLNMLLEHGVIAVQAVDPSAF